jgi:MFS family permease
VLASLRKYRNYRLYFGGQIVSYSGTFVQDTALPWLVLQRTHSPFDVGLLVFCRYGPFMIGGLYGGVIADRFDNRRVLMATQGWNMCIAAALAVVAFTDVGGLWPIYCSPPPRSCCSSWSAPAGRPGRRRRSPRCRPRRRIAFAGA